MARITLQSSRWKVFDDGPAVHDVDSVAEVFDDLHIVRNEENGQVELPL